MKILHTADWHIGKRLHKHDLSQDFTLFIEWLIDFIQKEQIRVILISGDIFDLANPSSEARRAYYSALTNLNQLKCKVILTGGNHDSPAVLNGPKELLESMDIHVIGKLPSNLEDCIIPINDNNGEVVSVIAALPFLRDPDVRNASDDFSFDNRVRSIREGIANIFSSAAELCQEKYPNVPAIAMGHLYAAGVSTSESERDIQIGNLASFEATNFGDYFSYVALGHIHKPQQLKASIPIFFSGSPIPLSFSEREDQKRLLVIETDSFDVRSIDIPTFRQLKKLSGSLDELKIKLDTFEAKGQLDTLLELELIEEHFDPAKIVELDRIVQEFHKEGAVIVKHRASFEKKTQGASELYDASVELEDLKPKEVFEKLLLQSELDDSASTLIREAFNEILEELQSGEQQ